MSYLVPAGEYVYEANKPVHFDLADCSTLGVRYGQLSARIVATCFATRDQPHPTREFARVAKLASAPGNVAAGVRMLRTIGDVVAKDEPLLEIHSSSAEQLDTAKTYAESRPGIIILGF
jgi:Pyrimidine nucleoside phosphorylase C-terminal domain